MKATWPAARSRLRQRGPQPALSDSAVLTVEVVGEYLGLDTHSAIYRHFRRHYGDWFLALRRVHRTTFARQAANLWRIKERLWLHLVVRAPRCRRFRSDAAFGNDVLARQTMYGFRVHVRVGIGRT